MLTAGCSATATAVREPTGDEYFARGRALVEAGKHLEAREQFEQARLRFRDSQGDARLLAALGDVNFELESFPEATDFYGQFMALHADNPLAPHVQYRLALCYRNQMRTQDRDPRPAENARLMLLRLLESYPGSPEAAEAVGQLAEVNRFLAESEAKVGRFYFRRENWRGVISRYETILGVYPGAGFDEEALYFLGEAHQRLSERDKAGEYFNRYLERFPGGKYAGAVRAFLAERRS